MGTGDPASSSSKLPNACFTAAVVRPLEGAAALQDEGGWQGTPILGLNKVLCGQQPACLPASIAMYSPKTKSTLPLSGLHPPVDLLQPATAPEREQGKERRASW